MRLVFMGTPGFALPSLEMLLDSEHDLLAVVTRPDRPQGRGLKEAPPPVKEFARERGLTVFQPQNLRQEDFVSGLTELQADLFVVVAFRILPREVYTMPPKGTIDLHPSMLPRYRGAAPINWAIINGETETGVSVFFIGEKIDAGDIILQRPVPIGPEETAGELSHRLARIGAQAILEAVDSIADDRVAGSTQPAGEPSAAPKIKREDGRIVWSRPAGQVKNLIRGLNPKPGAFTTAGDRVLKIHQAQLTDMVPSELQPGQVVKIDAQKGVFVSTGEGVLLLQEVQLEGKKRMSAADFLRGFHLQEGDLLV
ncbi:methionyl-tRNA formyltransferase [Candidatus Zixiibacteriota bacterium]